MTEIQPLHLKNEGALLAFTEEDIFGQIKCILEKFWLAPHIMRQEVKEIVLPLVATAIQDVIISGETKNISLYIIGESEILVIMPFTSIDKNIVLQEVYGDGAFPPNLHCALFQPNEALLHRLSLPIVFLVNPCVLENFPIPRLCLSISMVASYLRKSQRADVHVMDMQVGSTIEDIMQELLILRPALFGISISYGQKYLALSILKELYHLKEEAIINPLVVLGNIISASFPKEFLSAYPDSVIVCGEGERTIIELIEHLRGKRNLAEVCGIAFVNASGKLQHTLNKSVPMETIPLPALDTIEDIALRRGAITLELSRGCQWNVCTFCPREHKSNHWKTFTTQQILEQFEYVQKVCEKFHLKKHLFLADEEFLGGMNDGMETERIAEVAQALIQGNFSMSFDAAARVDQVYNSHLDRQWHIQRMKMWHLTRKAGLDRLFMGIESGSDAQLKRYGKGIKAEHSVFAIRILSALGIPLRFGFITFDQLMIGLTDLKENIAFLERNDAFMNEIDVEAYGYEKLFDLLLHDEDFIAAHSANKPIFSGISYMLASMEVLINSRYKVMLENAERRYNTRLILDADMPDTNMGRYKVEFLDTLIRAISISCQKWIDRHFGLSYAIKSLYKVAPKHERAYLSDWMIAFRSISLLLVKALVYIFDQEENDEYFKQMATSLQGNGSLSQITALRTKARSCHITEYERIIEQCMNLFDRFVEQENIRIGVLIESAAITDTKDAQIRKVMQRWEQKKGIWTLINGPNRSNVETDSCA